MMTEEPVRGTIEEGGRMQLGKQARSRPLPAPGPANERDETLDARIRNKLDRGEALTPEEKAYFARLPDHDVRYPRD